MPRPARPWFRFYVEAFSDRKLLRLTPTQRWIWVAVLGAARESPVSGSLLVADGIPMTRDELARYADVKVREVDLALDAMESLGMVTAGEPITVPHFTERQYESDSSTERSRKSRSEKGRSNNVATVVATTLQRCSNGRSNGPETETETETDLAGRKRPAGADKHGFSKVERDSVFDALTAVFGPAETRTSRGLRGKAVTELLDAGATPELVLERGKRLQAKGWTDCTEAALLKHWSALASETNGHVKADDLAW